MTGGPRLVFMGSPAIALPSLEALAGVCEIALVVTQPDRRSGRGRRLHPTPVRQRADQLGLDTMAVANVNRPEAVERIAALRPDAIIVVSFGQLLGRRLLQLPLAGCINVHFSLLPELRGAAPVSWAIMRGGRTTGVTIMAMVPEMDAGPVYAQRAEAIRDDDTAAVLSERLAVAGGALIADTLEPILEGRLEAVAQDDESATFAPKIERSLCAIDWKRPATEIDTAIRGLSGQLEAYCFMGEPPVRLVLFNSAAMEGPSPGPGKAARGPAGELLIGCGEGLVEIKEVQAQGKKRLPGRVFANGYHITGGQVFRNGQ